MFDMMVCSPSFINDFLASGLLANNHAFHSPLSEISMWYASDLFNLQDGPKTYANSDGSFQLQVGHTIIGASKG